MLAGYSDFVLTDISNHFSVSLVSKDVKNYSRSEPKIENNKA